MKLLMIAEHDNHVLKSSNQSVLTAATQLSSTIDCLVIGYHCLPIIEKIKKFNSIREVIVCSSENYEHQLAENTSELIASVAKNYDYVLSPATTFGKNLLPRVAALLDVAMISDVIQIISPDTFVRPIYAGNALATVMSDDKIKVLTIRTSAFAPMSMKDQHSAKIQELTHSIPNLTCRWISQELTESKRPELTSAKIIVSGGRGLKSAANFKLLETLADTLGAAMGASRAAVDAGFAPNDYQVGQTGKIVAPDLYIAIGISGAIQHIAGMKESKVIVAINSDPDAPIFQLADYGLVGDLFKILPELQTELKKATASI